MSTPESRDDEWSWFGVVIIITILTGLIMHAAGGWPWVEAWLQSPNAPAWVQAVGAVAAILASACIVGRQIRDARRLAAQAALRERQHRSMDAWRSFLALAQRASAACGVISVRLTSRDAIYSAAQAGGFDFGWLTVVERWLDRLDPLSTPGDLIDQAIVLSTALAKFRVLVEHCLRNHRAMDGEQFETWFAENRAEVTNTLQVVQRVYTDWQKMKSLYEPTLRELWSDARG